jgi:c-di-GMP-binding flagellar brake protein YcgR
VETLPLVPIDGHSPDEAGDFRVQARAEISTILGQLRDDAVTINLTSPSGLLIATQVWTADPATETVSFIVGLDHPQLEALIDSDEATAVAYLNSIKLQFDLEDLMLIRGADECVLHCKFPKEIFRFQRRNSFRVSPVSRTIPKANMRHPMIGDMQLELRVLDISMTGCALFLPHNVPPLEPGIHINVVSFLLDGSTRFTAKLHLQHVTALNPHQEGVRLGCEIVPIGAEGQRALQRYIDQNQKQQRLQAKQA